MGSGKTSWCFQELFNHNLDKNILYITPYLSEIESPDGRIPKLYAEGKIKRKLFTPKNQGSGKLDNISELLNSQMDIASTHALFRRFDDKCKQALADNEYTLILDETLTAVEPYQFEGKDDYKYLINNNDIKISDNGLIEWIGSDLNTRFDDVRILAKNQCLFVVDNKFYLWHFPHEIFNLFKRVYVLTYLFEGSLMKYYFDMYNLKYELKSIKQIEGHYTLVDYYEPDKTEYRERFEIYEGTLNDNVSRKENALSASWLKSNYHKSEKEQLRKNLKNFSQNIAKAKSKETLWTTYKKNKTELKAKGYANSFLACNTRATNDYSGTTCLMYCVNWYENPEIDKFFKQRNIIINQDKIALSTMLQWIWRSNIRITDSDKIINLYIPSVRMRRLFKQWLDT